MKTVYDTCIQIGVAPIKYDWMSRWLGELKPVPAFFVDQERLERGCTVEIFVNTRAALCVIEVTAVRTLLLGFSTVSTRGLI
jgi:hypothetical protein